MAQTASNPKIEELRFRLKTDPKSRLFYPLAEELRKANQSPEAEQVLRSGLAVHPTYLSAWVSLGRVLREQKKDAEAVDVLTKALQLDPGNVVAARLLADAYLALGEKVEAIKKYKLVHALLPADQEIAATIHRLELELNPPQVAPIEVAPPEPEEEEPVAEPAEANPFADAEEAQEQELAVETATADVEPMLVAHEESPFEEPAPEYTSAAFEIEAPGGMHISRAPLAAELPSSMIEDEPLPPPEAAVFSPEPLAPAMEESDVFAPTEPAPATEADDVANTLTMADLYARQGLHDDARHIYETILARDPGNAAVRDKLTVLQSKNKIAKLENWLAKMTRRDVGRV